MNPQNGDLYLIGVVVILLLTWYLGEKMVRAKIWAILWEAWAVKHQIPLGRFRRWVRANWKAFWLMLGYYWEVLGERFGRKKPETHEFTWLTYYVAVKRSLRHARMAKWSWGRSIDAETCLCFYDRYERVQKRAREKGYVRLASEDIHARYVTKELVRVK